MGAYIWTAERRAAQAQRARAKMPWRRSTGPRTAAGKKIVSMNSYRHGMRSAALKNLRDYMKAQRKFLQAVRYFHALSLKSRRQGLRQGEAQQIQYRSFCALTDASLSLDPSPSQARERGKMKILFLRTGF